MFTISDNGCGIPAGQRGQVVQRFVRLDVSRHRPGHGLGLAMVKAIITLHGGSLDLEDNSPGLRVRISFPACSALTSIAGPAFIPDTAQSHGTHLAAR
jgi:hypothetical protein